MNRSPRFEICRGEDGWWARFRAANGRVVWVTETYRRRHAAIMAIDHFGFYRGGRSAVINGFPMEVREVDQR